MQIAIELPDELVNRVDVKALSKEFVEYVVNKYAAKATPNTNNSQTDLDALLQDVPVIGSLKGKDPLALQHEMRHEWR